jgi:hypothetical protein
MTAEAFPLHWPEGWPRCEESRRSRYTVGYTQALNHLLGELRLLGAESVVVSTNIPTRRDGLPYANWTSRKMDDCGVAVYFYRDSKQQVIACDTWDRVVDNIRAVGLTVAALRGIDRAGATELLDRAFSGFKALPAPGETSGMPQWCDVLGCEPGAPLAEVKQRYRELSRKNHPDHGGDPGAMAMVNRAWEQAQAVLG